jgi:hypothetical protein
MGVLPDHCRCHHGLRCVFQQSSASSSRWPKRRSADEVLASMRTLRAVASGVRALPHYHAAGRFRAIKQGRGLDRAGRQYRHRAREECCTQFQPRGQPSRHTFQPSLCLRMSSVRFWRRALPGHSVGGPAREHLHRPRFPISTAPPQLQRRPADESYLPFRHRTDPSRR